MIDRNSVQQKIKDFEQRRGSEPVLSGEVFFYADGGYRDWDQMGVLAEPPENDFERLSNIVQYHRARLKHSIEKFDQLKEGAMLMGSGNRQVIEELKNLQTLVQQRADALRTAEAMLAQTPLAKQRAAAVRAEQERQQEREHFRQLVREVTI